MNKKKVAKDFNKDMADLTKKVNYEIYQISNKYDLVSTDVITEYICAYTRAVAKGIKEIYESNVMSEAFIDKIIERLKEKE